MASTQLKELVAQMPDADGRQMFTTNIDKERIEKALGLLLEGGAENLRQLIHMLGEPGSVEDVKPHYAAHCLENYALTQKDETRRRELCQVVAEELSGDHSVYVKSFLCQLLQWAGRKESAASLGKLLLDEQLVEPATMALVAIRDGAAEQFRAALPKSKGICRLNIVQGLGSVRDKEAAPALREALSDSDREVRLAAGWGLAQIGDTESVNALIKAADVAPGWERIQATKHCLVLAENLADTNKYAEATRIYQHLRSTRTDTSEAHIRAAADRGLAELP